MLDACMFIPVYIYFDLKMKRPNLEGGKNGLDSEMN